MKHLLTITAITAAGFYMGGWHMALIFFCLTMGAYFVAGVLKIMHMESERENYEA